MHHLERLRSRFGGCHAIAPGTLKDGVETAEKGTWSFTGGTGKLKGITGKGTYNCTPSGDGVSCDIEGQATTK